MTKKKKSKNLEKQTEGVVKIEIKGEKHKITQTTLKFLNKVTQILVLQRENNVETIPKTSFGGSIGIIPKPL